MDEKETSTGPRKETPKERTVRLLAKAREEVRQHDRNSRASQGKNQFSLSYKIRMTLPLIAIVFGLYGWSIIQTEKKYEDIKKRRNMTAEGSDDTELETAEQSRDEEFLNEGFKW